MSCTQNLRHLQFRCIHLAPKTFVVCNSSTYWNMVYIWTTNYLLRYININTILINILKLEPDFFRTRRLLLYCHIMSPTDHSSFQHLSNYLSAESCLSANGILCPMFRDIHVAHNTTLIYILHQTLPSFTVRRAIIDLAPKICVI